MTAPSTRNEVGTRTRRETRVVVVVPSRSLSAHFVDALGTDADISVVGQSGVTGEAASIVATLRPDVLILDLDGDGPAGQQAIEQIMDATPTPILVLLGTASGSTAASAALAAGAVEVMTKSTAWSAAFTVDIQRRVRVLRGVTVLRHRCGHRLPAPVSPPPPATPRPPQGRPTRVVSIAASTGGPAALAEVMAGIGGIQAPVLIVQHMHVDFIDGLVTWMDRVAPVPVRAAVDGVALESGVVYIGPGDVHLKIGPGRRIVLDKEPVTAHRPSADELFFSMAEHVGPQAIAVVLTGMGTDGAAGLRAMRQQGAVTISQDEATSIVFGMPKAAQLAGAASCVLPLDEIGPALVRASRGARL